MPVAIVYQQFVPPGTDTPLSPGNYQIQVVEGGTYRNLASRRKYTVLSINVEEETISYVYTRNDGERVEREGHPTDLAIVDAVGDSSGGLVRQEAVR